MGRKRRDEPEDPEGLPYVVPVPDDYYEKGEEEPDDLEEGHSAIPGTRPRFGWQENEHVYFRGPDGEMMDRAAWEKWLAEKERAMGGAPPPKYGDPLYDE